MGMLPFCQNGGVELIDEFCDGANDCAKKTARLTWSRAGATVFEGDGHSETEPRRLSSSDLRDLLDEFSTLDPRETDAGEIDCSPDSCPAEGRRLSYRADCSGVRLARMVMRAPLRYRLDEARMTCAPDDVWCIAGQLKHGLLGSRVSQRIARMRERLIDFGRGAR